MSIVRANKWQRVDGVNYGTILQVVSGRNGDYFSSSSTSWTDITSLTATITPYFNTSKILVTLSMGRATTSLNNLDYACIIRVLRNGSDDVAINGNTSSNRLRICMNVNGLAYNADHSPGGWSCQALDNPLSSSALTYKAQVLCQSATYPFIMNGSPNNSDTSASYHARGQSSITLMEIAQ
jgi:hypothetical protein